GGNTGGASGGNTGGASGGNTGGASGGNTGGASGTGGGGSTLHDCSPPSGTNTLKFTQVASGYSRPVWVGNAPGNSERLFVVEQPGRIRIIDNGVKVDQAFLDIASAKVESGGNEQGLLGLAFHPGYATNRRFYVNYTNKDGDTVIAEYQRSASEPDRAEPSSEKILMTVPQPQSNHNGGNLQFGPDGMLYIGLGDGGGGGDQHGANGNGQTLSTLLGKMLRIDVDGSTGGKPYGIPSGNMSGQNVLPEIWSYGLRNPWRWSFDVCTGDLYIGDVGQNTWEEIDVEPAGTGSGTNYGWRVMEGTHCYNPASGCDQSGKTLPVAEYNHSEGCSVTGGFVYRGKNIPALRGAYLYADFCSSQFWSFRYSGGAATGLKEITSEFTSGDVGQISSFGQDAHGELYVTDFGGRVWRIDAG
ncbi:MAG: PQQ-dependent sugar dehydrogenase, partial [Sorangiineae bacterium]|nr:PQQ-dependent sugar dehydrogenase [Sorangiineae bacterium]